MKIRRGQSGQILPIFAVFAMAMVLLLAYLIGLAAFLYAQQQLDGATEAAALASAQNFDQNQYRASNSVLIDCTYPGGTGPAWQGGTVEASGGPGWQVAAKVLAGNYPSAYIPYPGDGKGDTASGLQCASDGTVTLLAKNVVQSPFAGVGGLPGTITMQSVEVARFNATYVGT